MLLHGKKIESVIIKHLTKNPTKQWRGKRQERMKRAM